MRFNDRELIKLSEGRVDLEGILHHMKPQDNNWSDWYQQPSFKERIFKLISNLLFYYRVGEQEPLGVLVLENAQVAYERPHKGIPFAFSITFKLSEKQKDPERKHIFSCRCQEDVNKWVTSLKMASYEHWRSQFIILKTKLSMRTGKDPVLDYLRSQCQRTASGSKEKKLRVKKANFQSHIQMDAVETSADTTNENEIKSDDVTVGKLIDI